MSMDYVCGAVPGLLLARDTQPSFIFRQGSGVEEQVGKLSLSFGELQNLPPSALDLRLRPSDPTPKALHPSEAIKKEENHPNLWRGGGFKCPGLGVWSTR